MKRNIVRSIFLISAVMFFLLGSSGAYLSDTVEIKGNTFTAGTWSNESDEQSVTNAVNNILENQNF